MLGVGVARGEQLPAVGRQRGVAQVGRRIDSAHALASPAKPFDSFGGLRDAKRQQARSRREHGALVVVAASAFPATVVGVRSAASEQIDRLYDQRPVANVDEIVGLDVQRGRVDQAGPVPPNRARPGTSLRSGRTLSMKNKQEVPSIGRNCGQRWAVSCSD